MGSRPPPNEVVIGTTPRKAVARPWRCGGEALQLLDQFRLDDRRGELQRAVETHGGGTEKSSATERSRRRQHLPHVSAARDVRH
jgi:hypothetical protein